MQEKWIDQYMQRRKIAKHTQFLWEGDSSEEVYYVIRGNVKVFHRSVEGREQVLSIIKANGFINTVTALEPDGVNRANASALTDLELAFMPRSNYLKTLHDSPEFSNLILRDFAQKLHQMAGLVEELSLHNTRQRLINFLLRNIGTRDFVKGWTQEEIAAQIGSVRDVVSRLLGTFSQQGLIRVERQRIIIIEEEKLRAEIEE